MVKRCFQKLLVKFTGATTEESTEGEPSLSPFTTLFLLFQGKWGLLMMGNPLARSSWGSGQSRLGFWVGTRE